MQSASNLSRAKSPQTATPPQKFNVASATNKIMVHDIKQSTPIAILNESNKSEYKNWDVWNLSWSHDGQLIAFCEDNNNKIILSKSESGAFLKSFIVCEEGVSVSDVCFSSDSTQIAFGCNNGFVGIINLKSKKIEAINNNLSPGVPIKSVQFNNNDQHIAVATIDGVINVTNLSDRSVIQLYDKDKITSMKFSVVKATILASSYETGKIVIWDLTTGAKKLEIQPHQTQCTGFAFSPVNNLLMCSCGMDGKIQFYDIATGKNVKSIECQAPLNSIAFCADGSTIAVGSFKGKILIYDLKDKQKLKFELKGQEGKKINCLHFQRLFKDQGKLPSSIQILQGSTTLAMRQSQEKHSAQKTLHEVQNTTQQQKSVSSVNMNKNLTKAGSGSGTPLSNKSALPPSHKSSTKDVQRQEEQTIKYLEEQKIDDTKKRLEQQLMQLQQEIQAKPLTSLITTAKYDNSQPVTQKSNGSFQLSLQNLSQLPQSKPPVKQPLYDIPQKNIIREEHKEDDDDLLMMEHLDHKKQPKGETKLNFEIKSFIEEVFDQKATDFKMQLQSSINNLHMELIRNFQHQEDDLRETMNEVAKKNKRRRKELKHLREENKKLR